MNRALLLAATLLPQWATAQQLLWQIPSPPSSTQRIEMYPYTDHDGDGYRDLLEAVLLNSSTTPTQAIQVVSGRDGSVLWSRTDPVGRLRYAGDMNGDGRPELLVLQPTFGRIGYVSVSVYSTSANAVLWEASGLESHGFGSAFLGNLDLDADGRPDVVVITSSFTHSWVYAYANSGRPLFSFSLLPTKIAISLGSLGDVNGDGGDDFVIGATDPSDRGALVVVSGRTGAVIRESYGLLPGDRTAEHASNLGDLDGDGVNDYGAFPYWSAFRAMAVAYSGATGALLQSWPIYGNSVVTGEDVDLDGVPDVVYGADYIVSPNVYGSTRALSGRDGTELWRVDNFRAPPGSGTSNGSSAWMESSASLGVQPGSPYPVIGWLDVQWFAAGTGTGRIRAYRGALDGQGPVTGTPCSNRGAPPQIGARNTTTGARVTVAKAPAGALAWLSLSFPNQTSYGGHPLPLDLSPFGLPGCTMYVAPIALHLRVTGTTGIDRGYAAVDFPFRLTAAATGIDAVAQWLVLDPVTLDYAATAMHRLRGN